MDKTIKSDTTSKDEKGKIINPILNGPDKIILLDQNIDQKEEKKITEDAKAKALALEKTGQKISIINVDELAEAEAHKAADDYIVESASNKKTNIFKKIWKHTFFEEYYRGREINRVREEIKGSENIYTRRGDNLNKSAHEKTMKAISDRFVSEYDGTLSEGEEKKIINNQDSESVKARDDIKDLIDGYACGKIDEGAFKSQKIRILDSLKKDELLKGAKNYTDNLFEIATNAKEAISHGAKMEELKYDLDIIVGKAKSSLKTEAHFNLIDKTVDRIKNTKVGSLISPAVLNVAIGAAYSASVIVGKKVFTGKLATLYTFGAAVGVSAAFAGIEESHKVAQERKQHGLELAEGGSIKKDDKRRNEIERFGYKMERSKDIEQKLHDLVYEKAKDGNDVAKDLGEEDIKKVIDCLSDLDARNSLNSKKKIDLISYSGIGEVEKERTALTILAAKAKLELKKRVNDKFKNIIPEGKTLEEYLAERVQLEKDVLAGGEKGITAQDKSFRKYKAGRVGKKMLKTAGMGLVIGATIQEVIAFAREDVQGLVEGVFRSDDFATTETPLKTLAGIAGNALGLEGEVYPTVLIDQPSEIIFNAEDYIANHDTVEVDRMGWYDNDTPGLFDKNELGIQWGGESGSRGINTDGNYELNIKSMLPDGSYHGDLSIDPEATAKAGALKMVFSLTEGTQNQVFELPVDASGKIIIDPDSEIGKLFFETEDGQAVFKGKFAEIVETLGEKDGVSQIRTISTLVGEGNDVIKDIINIPIEVPVDVNTELPFYLPITTRKSMDQIVHNNQDKAVGNNIKQTNDKKVLPIENQEKNNDVKKIEVLSEDKISDNKFEKSVTLEKEEYASMDEDIKMLNRKTQLVEGIITLEIDNFKSKYGKKRYLELKNIGPGVPVTFNKYELDKIATEMEGYLSSPKLINKKESEKIKPEILKEITEEKELKTAEADDKKEIIQSEFSENDLSKPGTEFYDEELGAFKVAKLIEKTNLFGSTKIEVINIDKNGKERTLVYKKSFLEKQFRKGNIKINKIQQEK